MNLPVRPPIFPKALPTPLAAPAIAGPADEATLVKPSEAFDWKLAAVSDAFDDALEAVSLAASVAFAVVLSNRRADLPESLAVWRRAAREMDSDMMEVEYALGGPICRAAPKVTDGRGRAIGLLGMRSHEMPLFPLLGKSWND